MSKFHLNKRSLTLFFVLLFSNTYAQTGNRVFTGAEMVNFGTVSLSTPAGKTWTTDRLATPGYFSAVGTATYSNASDANNINGYVKKYGNQTYTFPVGDGIDLRTLRISSAPTASTDSYATAWILGDPSGNLDPTGPNGGPHNILSVTFPIYAVSAVGQWDWQAGVNMGTTGDGVNLMITVSMPDMSSFALTANLRLVGWNGTSWVDLSGMSTATGNTENHTLFGYMQAGISAVAIGSSYWVLPVKLNSFTARENNCNAQLNWVTSDEENLDRFEMEQSSNGFSFQKVGTVNAKGDKTQNSYSLTVTQSQKDAYYRLKMINKDGSFTYSEVKYVKTECTRSTEFITVFPNPVKETDVNINFSTAFSGLGQLIILNEVGQQIMKKTTNISSGNNTIKCNLNQFPIGVYFIQVLNSNGEPIFEPQKIIKK